MTEYNAGQSGTIDAPLLLIDDEADSASVNTSPLSADPTEINKRIRALLRLFTRSSYIGFTATPFANIFINPDTENQMLGDDLFPRDFIYTLEAPTNYVGPLAMFGEEPPARILQSITDADVVFPAKHKSSLIVNAFPETLSAAVRAFILANTIRDLRGHAATHRSMLVNVSRFTAVQDQVAALISSELSRMQQDIRNYSQLAPDTALRNKTLYLCFRRCGATSLMPASLPGRPCRKHCLTRHCQSSSRRSTRGLVPAAWITQAIEKQVCASLLLVATVSLVD